MSLLIGYLVASSATLLQTAPAPLQKFEYEQVVRCYFIYDAMAEEALERDDVAWTRKFVTATQATGAMAKGVGKATNRTEAQVNADLAAAYDKYIGQYSNIGLKVNESIRCDRALGLDTRKPPR
jgi:hypothetical protein